MIERPEAVTLARQLNDALDNKRVMDVIVDKNPHKMAWLNEDRNDYIQFLKGQTFEGAYAYGGQVELQFGNKRLLVADGINVRLWEDEDSVKVKHQLALYFNNAAVLTFTVQMYGGIWTFLEGTNDNPYYLVAKDKPSVDDSAFTLSNFCELVKRYPKLSLKAFLATEQRIPGFGNGVLQDVLFEARLHPKTKVGTLNDKECEDLYSVIKETINTMIALGGRNLENDLFGKSGGYKTKMSKLNKDQICPRCQTTIVKENYMGGSVYYCPKCQVHESH